MITLLDLLLIILAFWGFLSFLWNIFITQRFLLASANLAVSVIAFIGLQ